MTDHHTTTALVQPAHAAAQIVSFGYLHGPLLDENGGPLPVDLMVDLRRHFRDPHVDPALRQLTALDDAVRTAVRNTAGITDLVATLTGAVLAYRSGPSAHRHPVTVATGCAGGRHRSVDRTTEGHAGRERIPRLAWSVNVAHPDDEGAQRS